MLDAPGGRRIYLLFSLGCHAFVVLLSCVCNHFYLFSHLLSPLCFVFSSHVISLPSSRNLMSVAVLCVSCRHKGWNGYAQLTTNEAEYAPNMSWASASDMPSYFQTAASAVDLQHTRC